MVFNVCNHRLHRFLFTMSKIRHEWAYASRVAELQEQVCLRARENELASVYND